MLIFRATLKDIALATFIKTNQNPNSERLRNAPPLL